MTKQTDFFKKHDIKHIDYKDVEILKRFLNPHGRILNRRVTGLTAKNQRAVTLAIKRARFMGLMPYIMS
jgi:small subunit ribosomal protein S18